MTHHIIFEGAELSGKSYLMSQVYNYLEPKYNNNGGVLDGCHWLNCDVGIYGTKHGKSVIKNYMGIAKELKDKNLLFEKFHVSDIIYNRLHRKKRSILWLYRAEAEKIKFQNSAGYFSGR